jgi:hypothetical protein
VFERGNYRRTFNGMKGKIVPKQNNPVEKGVNIYTACH